MSFLTGVFSTWPSIVSCACNSSSSSTASVFMDVPPRCGCGWRSPLGSHGGSRTTATRRAASGGPWSFGSCLLEPFFSKRHVRRVEVDPQPTPGVLLRDERDGACATEGVEHQAGDGRGLAVAGRAKSAQDGEPSEPLGAFPFPRAAAGGADLLRAGGLEERLYERRREGGEVGTAVVAGGDR